MANETHKIKLLVLWDILCKYTDETHHLNTDEIIKMLADKGINVSRKILSQDIALLNDSGYEILSYKKKYYYYYVVNRPFDTAEIIMLSDVVKASKLTPTQKNMVIDKLFGMLCSGIAAEISPYVISTDKYRHGNSSIIYSVDAIEQAIKGNKKVSFLYFDYDEKHTKIHRKGGNRYYANPVGMVWNRDNYYLLCFTNGHDDMVTYRLDKMEDVKVETYEREPHDEYELFNTEEYRKQVFSMFGGEPQKVTLTFTKDMISEIFDRFGDDLHIRKGVDETFSADVTVQVSKPFFVWLVGTLGKVKIKSPSCVKTEFDNFTSEIIKSYCK